MVRTDGLPKCGNSVFGVVKMFAAMRDGDDAARLANRCACEQEYKAEETEHPHEHPMRGNTRQHNISLQSPHRVRQKSSWVDSGSGNLPSE